MTPAELRDEITTGPLAAELAPLWAAGDDTGTAGVLNEPRFPGYVPARHAVVELMRTGKFGMVDYGVLHKLLPNDQPCPFPLYSLFSSLHVAAYGTVTPAPRLEVEPLTAALTAVVSAGLLTVADRDAILAGEVPISRAEVVWGYDVSVSANQVGEARNMGA